MIPIAVKSISDPTKIRVQLLASGQDVHAPLNAVAGASIHGATAKATPVDADEFGYYDSVSQGPVKATWANIKATLKTYFDTLYQPLAATLTSWAAITRASGFDTFSATPTSANLAALLTDETGTGAAVFANAPTITGNPVFSGKPSLAGGALSFPATQIPSAGANDLDDYEEGTWTPGVSFVTPGDLAVTYTTQSGRYVKIGSMVFFNFLVAPSSFTYTTASGFFIMTGFPFTMAANFVGAGTLLMQGWTRANYTGLMLETSNSTFMYANAMGSGQTASELTTAHVASGGSIRIYGAGFYTV